MPGDHLPGDGLGHGHVALSVIVLDIEVPAGDPAALGQAGDHPVAAVVQNGLGGVLEQGDADGPLRSGRGDAAARRPASTGPGAGIGKEQHRGGSGDEHDAPRKRLLIEVSMDRRLGA